MGCERIVLAVMLVFAWSYDPLCSYVVRAEDDLGQSFSFVPQAKLTEQEPVTEDQFGSSVTLDSDTAIIGVPGHDEAGLSSGAAYVFRRDTQSVWQQTQKLTASDAGAGHFFGTSVALSGDIALIGARGVSSRGSFSGAVYVFTRDSGGIWREVQILTASDGTAGHFFGWRVIITGDTALIGAPGNGDDPEYPGAVYLFIREDNGQWRELQKLTAGGGGDEFGYSIALLTDELLVGARGADEKGNRAGTAYVFSREPTGQWVQCQKLTASDGMAGDEFGYSVALQGATAAVGARFGIGAEAHAGAVYVYEYGTGHIGTAWSEVQKLTASAGSSGDEFGSSVAINSKAIVIGTPEDEVVYVFAPGRDEPGFVRWRELQEVRARDAVVGDRFGTSLDLKEDVVIIGSPLDDPLEDDDEDNDEDEEEEEEEDDVFSNTGSVYVFILSPAPATCTAKIDYTDAQCAKTFDVASLADLDEYVETDFGRADNDGRYTNLRITANLSDTVLDIHSPCEIVIAERITLAGDFVSVDGRKGVVGKSFGIEAERACILSGQEQVALGKEVRIDAGELTLRAEKAAAIGKDSLVTADGALTIESSGAAESSKAMIDSGTVVAAGSIRIQASHTAQLGADTAFTVDGAILLVSTGNNADGTVIVKEGAQIRAEDLTITSPHTARVGKNARVSLSGNLQIETTEDGSQSHALIEKDAGIIVTGNAEINSGNKVTVDKNVQLSVTGSLRIEAGSAGQCKIKGSAQVSAGTRSGNCF